MKQCSKCSELKSFDQFGKNKTRIDGYEYWCKQCKSTYPKSKEWFKANPNYFKEYRLKNTERQNEYNKQYRRDRYKNKTQLIKDNIIKNHNSIQPGVYMIKNLLTNKCYIGSSKIPYARRTHHFSVRKSSANNINIALQEDLVKQNKKGFVFGIIEHCEPEQLLEREQYYINQLKPEYNLK